MSVVNKLWRSRVYQGETMATLYQSPVADLVRKIEAECEARGLTLSRWQANKSSHATTITYAIHTGERADQFRHQPEETIIDYFRLFAIEGTTERCNAYKRLMAMLEYLTDVGVKNA